MTSVMIGVDPHKSSHTAVAINGAEVPLGRLRVRACADQAGRLLAWAQAWPERTWAVEGATGLGHLLAQQLVAAGERVLDIQPKLAARVRVLEAGNTSKNDPNDALSVAVAALRSRACREVAADDHAAVLRMRSRRHQDLGQARNRLACRLHAVLCDLVPGGLPKEITANQAERLIEQAKPSGAVSQARRELAAELLADLRHLDAQLAGSKTKLATVVKASGTSLTGLFGVGPVVAAIVTGDAGAVTRFGSRAHFAAWNGTAPVEVSSGGKKIYRLSRRGNRRVNSAIHIAAVTQIRYHHSPGRAYYDKKIAEGKTPKEALRCLKRRISDAIYARLVADARKATAAPEDPGGQPGNGSDSSAAGSHPERQLFGQATPGPRHHPTTTARSHGNTGHSPAAATLPPAKPQVQVERPQRSEDERPGGAARRRPYSATGKALGPRPPVKPQPPKAIPHAAKKTTATS
jgi:transposase